MQLQQQPQVLFCSSLSVGEDVTGSTTWQLSEVQPTAAAAVRVWEESLLLAAVLRSGPEGASGISISASAMQEPLLVVGAVVGRVMAVAS